MSSGLQEALLGKIRLDGIVIWLTVQNELVKGTMIAFSSGGRADGATHQTKLRRQPSDQGVGDALGKGEERDVYAGLGIGRERGLGRLAQETSTREPIEGDGADHSPTPVTQNPSPMPLAFRRLG